MPIGADLLQMQDEIVTRLARALEIKLAAVDAARVQQTRPGNLDAEDLAMRCEVGMYNAFYAGVQRIHGCAQLL